jgi:hypothetical protein
MAGRSTSSRIALRTLTLSNGGMSTAMQSGSQPPPGDSRILMLLWLFAVELRERDVRHRVDRAGKRVTCADGSEVDHLTVSKYGCPLRRDSVAVCWLWRPGGSW